MDGDCFDRITHGALRASMETGCWEYEALLANFPNLRILDITRAVAREASMLRASLNLRPADALVLGTALNGGATAFLTNGRVFARARAGINVILLDKFPNLD